MMSASEAFHGSGQKRTLDVRPHECRHFDLLGRDANAVDGARPATAGPVADRSRCRDDRASLRVLDEMHRLLMVVTAQHQVDVHLSERTQDLLRVLEPVTLRELALHRVVMHHDDPRIALARTLEFDACALDLPSGQVADDRDVAHVPCERLENDALRCVQPDERRAADVQHRLEIAIDIRTVLRVHPVRIADAERRKPPRNVVVARHDDRAADALRLSQKRPRALELTGARALRHVARHGHHIVLALVDQRLDRFVLLGHCRMPEVQVRAMKEGRDQSVFSHSFAMMASVNSSVDAVPPRSRVTVLPSVIVDSSADRMRPARSVSPMWSSSMHAASTTAPGLAIPFPAMSGAVPWTASKIAPFTPMFAPGARPRPPTRPEIWSDRISPKRFVVTMTSNRSGWSTRFIAIASTI